MTTKSTTTTSSGSAMNPATKRRRTSGALEEERARLYKDVSKGLDDVQSALRGLNKRMETFVKEGSAADVRLADWIDFFRSEKILVVPKREGGDDDDEEDDDDAAEEKDDSRLRKTGASSDKA